MHVIGDVHGEYDKLCRLLRGARLVDGGLRWSGGESRLTLVGDFFDRGPDGIGVVELVMRLQGEAAAAGGAVHALLGNHDALLLSAHRFGGYFLLSWRREGGQDSDIERLSPAHSEWLTALPAMAVHGGRLYVHADAEFYMRYGGTVDKVNARIRRLLRSDDQEAWDRLLDDFAERRAFDGPGGSAASARFLARYGGRQLIHGHTPIEKVTGTPSARITEAYTYADGLCVNVDGGMVRGGPGFVYEAGE